MARLVRKANAIEDLLYSSKNFITVKENLAQYDDIFKLIIKNHGDNCKILKSEEQLNEEYHSEDVDQRVFIFKHKVRKWLKDAEDMIRNQSNLVEVQKVDYQKYIRDHEDQAQLQAEDHQKLIL